MSAYTSCTFIPARKGEGKVREEIHYQEHAGEALPLGKEKMVHTVDLGGKGGKLEVAQGAFAELRDLVQRAKSTGGCEFVHSLF